MRRRFVVIGLLGFFCSPSHALDCKSGGGTQADMNQCADARFKASDAQLNGTYKKVMACLGPTGDGATSLVDAQRAWLRYRDAECKFQGSASDGGSVQPMVIGSCLASITDRRTKELKDYLTCQEGDLSCPVHDCNLPDGAGRPAQK